MVFFFGLVTNLFLLLLIRVGDFFPLAGMFCIGTKISWVLFMSRD